MITNNGMPAYRNVLRGLVSAGLLFVACSGVFVGDVYAQSGAMDPLLETIMPERDPRNSRATETYRRAHEIRAEIASRTGWAFRKPLILFGPYSSEEIRASTGITLRIIDAVTVGVVQVQDSSGRDVWHQAGDYVEACGIIVGDSLVQPGISRTDRDAVLAHEITHCLQKDMLSPREDALLPQWVKEGAATYVGETMTGGSSLVNDLWVRYLQAPIPLFERNYDGFGFFWHLEGEGVDVMHLLPGIFQAQSSPLAFLVATSGSGRNALKTWAPSVRQDASLGASWIVHAPNAPPASRETSEVSVTEASPLSVAMSPASQSLYEISLEPGKVISIGLSGHGIIRWDHGSSSARDEPFSGGFGGKYCIGRTCDCEDGTPPPGVQIINTGQVLLGISADGAGGSVAFLAEKPECESPSCPFPDISANSSPAPAPGYINGSNAEIDALCGAGMRSENRIDCLHCRRVESMPRNGIDRCPIGKWRLERGLWKVLADVMQGVSGVPVAVEVDGDPDLVIDKDGTMSFTGFNIKKTMSHNGAALEVSANLKPGAGRWNARDGRLEACSITDGRATRTMTIYTPNGPMSFPGDPALPAQLTGGSFTYECSPSELMIVATGDFPGNTRPWWLYKRISAGDCDG